LDDVAESTIKPEMRGSILKLSDLAMDIVGDDPLVSAALRRLIRSTGVTNFETFNRSGESQAPREREVWNWSFAGY
jgi:hypothetical protein